MCILIAFAEGNVRAETRVRPLPFRPADVYGAPHAKTLIPEYTCHRCVRHLRETHTQATDVSENAGAARDRPRFPYRSDDTSLSSSGATTWPKNVALSLNSFEWKLHFEWADVYAPSDSENAPTRNRVTFHFSSLFHFFFFRKSECFTLGVEWILTRLDKKKPQPRVSSNWIVICLKKNSLIRQVGLEPETSGLSRSDSVVATSV